jgi:MATE family multidrug resistance protein
VLLSLVAEPLTGLADTAFVARLGAGPLAALGVGTIVLSSIFWIFNFLGIGTQTEVARDLGAGEGRRACEVTGLALALSGAFGVALILLGLPLLGPAATAMGAQGEVHAGAATYLRIRLLGAPAVLLTTTSFGALRGLQDMRTPLRIAVTINALNVLLDAVLIFGLGPIPALGIAGAAWATVAAHWIGGLWGLAAVRSRLGLPSHLRLADARNLLVVGRDLFLRTGLLTAFLLLTTRAATRIGPEAGAAHQAIRQVWLFTALLLDAYAATAQSLVGFFRGAGRPEQMRRVAFVACAWSLGTGAALSLAMWAGQGAVARWLVPAAAHPLFTAAWLVAAATQPLNALSFATDGIHWGTGDYRFLRNAMIVATGLGAAGIFLLDEAAPGALTLVWVVSAAWIAVRAALGVARIWPGIGASPFLRGGDPPA